MAGKQGYRSYADVEAIPALNAGLVSTGSCASLVMHYTRVGQAKDWKQGERVRGNTTIKRGTAIATFVNAVYPNFNHGNHAALYVRQEADGIWVVEQWKELDKPQKRKLLFKGPNNANGPYVDPSNNGDAFSIIDI
jgi:hypothetical protein